MTGDSSYKLEDLHAGTLKALYKLASNKPLSTREFFGDEYKYPIDNRDLSILLRFIEFVLDDTPSPRIYMTSGVWVVKQKYLAELLLCYE